MGTQVLFSHWRFSDILHWMEIRHISKNVKLSLNVYFVDDILDPPTMVTLPSISTDISEQNVPETGEKFDPVDVTEIVSEGDESKTHDDHVKTQLEQKT